MPIQMQGKDGRWYTMHPVGGWYDDRTKENRRHKKKVKMEAKALRKLRRRYTSNGDYRYATTT